MLGSTALAPCEPPPTTEQVLHRLSRTDIIGSPTHRKISELGIVQFRHHYDSDLLDRILRRAVALKAEKAEKRHLDLTYIRGAQRFIPEINDLIYDASRLDRVSALAGTPLEPYPISVISSIVTFMGPKDQDGAITWHCDGVPVSELIPLAMEEVEGGELEIYRGNPEVGLSRLEQGIQPRARQLIKVKHRLGCSTMGQFFRVMHRTAPIRHGYRVTLNLNLRSRDKPFIDDNSLVYLGADNPDGTWIPELLKDVSERQLPAYKAVMGVA